MPSGKRCHSPALSDKAYCYYHLNLRRLRDPASRDAQQLPIPAIEDANGIQIALTQVLSALNSPYMDTRRAGLLLYGLNLAAHLTSRISAPEPSECIRALPSENESELLAPVVAVCEPPDDCLQCAQWETCEKSDKADEDDFEEEEQQDEQDDEEDTCEDDEDEDEEEDQDEDQDDD